MQHSFFNRESFDLKNASISYERNFLNEDYAHTCFNKLLASNLWQEDDIVVFGKRYKQPRLTILFGEKPYAYSNIKMTPHPFPSILMDIKQQIEQITGSTFNVCLANLYRDGSDSNGWHSDNEKELGKNPTIASLSLGAERFFHLKHHSDPSQKIKILLEHNSLLIMAGETQHFWKHQIPKTKKEVGQRINLTFRHIL